VAEDLWQALHGNDPAIVIYFATPSVPPQALAQAMAARFGDATCLGCTTAGEIAPHGYATGSVTAIAFPRAHFRARMLRIDGLRDRVVSDCMRLVRDFGMISAPRTGWHQIGLLLVDGMSGREEMLIAAIDAALPATRVVGGSAGDDLAFRATAVFHDGAAHHDAAILCLIETDFDVEDICIDHFVPTATRMVVTRSDPANRLVLEINAEPAVEEYARLVGVPPDRLTPFIFASNPLLVRAGGRYHVRSIQQVVEGGGLRLLSAIDDGLVLTLGRPEDIHARLTGALAALPRAPDLILGLDCILRRLDVERQGLSADVSRTLSRHRVVGFSTYGEQHRGIHVNQTFVGVAFFAPG